MDPQLQIAAGERGARARSRPGLAGSRRGLRARRRARAIADRVERTADILDARQRRSLLLANGRSGSGRGLRLSGLDLRPGGHREQDAESDSGNEKVSPHIRSISKTDSGTYELSAGVTSRALNLIPKVEGSPIRAGTLRTA